VRFGCKGGCPSFGPSSLCLAPSSQAARQLRHGGSWLGPGPFSRAMRWHGACPPIGGASDATANALGSIHGATCTAQAASSAAAGAHARPACGEWAILGAGARRGRCVTHIVVVIQPGKRGGSSKLYLPNLILPRTVRSAVERLRVPLRSSDLPKPQTFERRGRLRPLTGPLLCVHPCVHDVSMNTYRVC
jgi:hypothetical protein